MKVAVFNTKPYDRAYFTEANESFGHDIHFFNTRLTEETVTTAVGFPCVCVFVNDFLDTRSLEILSKSGTKLVALRCAGYNNVDVKYANQIGLPVVRVPSYSPYSVAEHTIALMISLCRKTHRAYHRVKDGNFSLQGLLGFELHNKKVGIIGTGKIGYLVAKILKGFGCDVIANDLYENPEFKALGVRYKSLDEIFTESDVISLHCPLTKDTHHLIDASAFSMMKDGVMLINTGRGAIIDSVAAINAIKSGKLGFLGIDVYEQEDDLFFEDRSNAVIDDDTLQILLSFPNVLITGHQGFFTDTALQNIAETTLQSIRDFELGTSLEHRIQVT